MNNEAYMKDNELKLLSFFSDSAPEAEELLKDEDKMERFLQRLEKKLKTVPLAGSSLAYVPMMISMVRKYVKKEYTDPPFTSILAIILTLVYVLSPIDLIPDGVPGLGYVDDAFVVSACLKLIFSDLEDYRIWRQNNGMVDEDIPEYDNISKDNEKFNAVAKILATICKNQQNK